MSEYLLYEGIHHTIVMSVNCEFFKKFILYTAFNVDLVYIKIETEYEYQFKNQLISHIFLFKINYLARN